MCTIGALCVNNSMTIVHCQTCGFNFEYLGVFSINLHHMVKYYLSAFFFIERIGYPLFAKQCLIWTLDRFLYSKFHKAKLYLYWQRWKDFIKRGIYINTASTTSASHEFCNIWLDVTLDIYKIKIIHISFLFFFTFLFNFSGFNCQVNTKRILQTNITL